MKFYQRAIILAIIILNPVLIWISMQPLSTRFSNLSTATTSLGQLASIIGLILFSLTFLLNTRFKFLDNAFEGLDKMYQAHHHLGTAAFILLLFHPLLLSVKFISYSAKTAINFLLPGNNLTTTFGFFAIVLMILFLILTFLVTIKYNKWKFTHQLLGIAFILASVHILTITSDISRSKPLYYYTLFFVILGIICYLYRTPFSKYLVKKYEYKVIDVKKLNPKITEITLQPIKEKLHHKPGQFIFISFNQQEFKEQHPFTISSSPNEENLRLTIKNTGDYTSKLDSLQSGTIAYIEGPFGYFTSEKYMDKSQIWISGGIGITPFLSMARAIAEKTTNEILFYYCFRNKEEDSFSEELKQISKKNKKLRITPFCTSKDGRININHIEKENPNLKEKEIFICGPKKMIRDLRKEFINLGVSKNKLHSEEFNL